MKAKVLSKFKDKYNGKVYYPDDVIIISRERYEEILSVGRLVEEIKTKKKTAEAENAE